MAGGVIILGTIGEANKPKAPQPTKEDLVITKKGDLRQEASVKKIRGLKPGQTYTFGQELGYTREIQFIKGSEQGGNANASFFGLVGGAIEAKVSESLGISIGQVTTETHTISVSGNDCPDHDFFVTKTFRAATIAAPKFSREEIPFKVQVDVKLSAVNLCNRATFDL